MYNWTYYNSFLGSAVDERVDNAEIFNEASDQDGEGHIVQDRVQHTASLVDPQSIVDIEHLLLLLDLGEACRNVSSGDCRGDGGGGEQPGHRPHAQSGAAG